MKIQLWYIHNWGFPDKRDYRALLSWVQRFGPAEDELDVLMDECRQRAAVSFVTGCIGFLILGIVVGMLLMSFTIKQEHAMSNLPAKLLQEAATIVSGSRNDTHGSYMANFEMIAKMWSTYLGRDVTPLDVTQMMIMVKISRAKCGGPTKDHFLDEAGYAGIAGAICEEEKVQRSQTPTQAEAAAQGAAQPPRGIPVELGRSQTLNRVG